MEDIKNQTPQAIDTVLVGLFNEEASVQNSIAGLTKTIARAEKAIAEGTSYGYHEPHMARYNEDLAACRAGLVKVQAEIAPLEAEFARRGGWTRFFIVRNSNGHVHNSMNCVSCNKGVRGTDFGWLVEQSGKTEAEIVELARSGACTFCFPSAPVDKRENTLVLPEVAAARAAKAAKAEAKAAEMAIKGIKGIDGEELCVIEGRWDRATQTDVAYFGRVLKTERAARNEISSDLWNLAWYGMTHPSTVIWIKNINHLAAAVANKTGEDVQELLNAVAGRVIVKVKKDGSTTTLAQLLTWVNTTV